MRLELLPSVLVLALACGAPTAPPPSAPAEPEPTTSAASSAKAPAPAPSASAAAPAVCAPLVVKLPPLIEKPFDVPVPPLEDFSEKEQMAPFYEKLARLARGKSEDSVRIAMYGDSNLTRDEISGELRRALQQELGDGGHGYIAVGRPWTWYIHTDVRHGADPKAWKVFSMSTDQVADHLYGFAGLAAQNRYQKARAWVRTAEEGAPVGTRVSRVEVWFLRRPDHGTFEVEIDGKQVGTVDSAGTEIAADRVRFDVPDAAHEVEVVSTSKLVRLLGIVLERSQPGVVVDSLGIGGVNAELLARGDRKLTIQTLRMRKSDLVLMLTGATEPDSPGHVKAVAELVARHREALPDAPFVLMSPPDLAGGTAARPTKSVRINQIDKQKRQAAREAKTVFWDFRKAMGGELSIVRFAEHKMAWKDFIHLAEPGSRYMGRRLAHALMRDFQRYVGQHPSAGCQNSAGSL